MARRVEEVAAKRRTQSERKAESERRLIIAARRLFAEQGYMRTTLSEVGAAAGYTGPLVSARFGSKEELLRAVVKHISGTFLNDQVRPATEAATATASIENYIEVYLLEVTKRESHIRSLYAIMGEAISAVPEIRGEVAKLTRRMRADIAERVTRGIEAGEFNEALDAKAAATMIIGLLRGITLQALIDPREIPVKNLIPEVQSQVLSSLTAP